MPNWNEAEFVKRAGDIAREFATTKKPLNDLCEKVARDETLNPDEIRTLVRLSNVAAFQQLFKDKATADAPDRMVEFDVGQPESVIQRIQSSVEDPPAPANIHNDKLAYEIPDQMREVRLGRKFDGVTKVAHEDAPERRMRKDLAIIAARKLASEMDIARYEASHKWDAAMASLHHEFKKAAGYGADFASFAKDAFSEYGEEALPEIAALAADLRYKHPLPSAEKIAFLVDRHVTEDTAELKLLKQALDARAEYTKLQNGGVSLQKLLKA